jgi:hypothetical protein
MVSITPFAYLGVGAYGAGLPLASLSPRTSSPTQKQKAHLALFGELEIVGETVRGRRGWGGEKIREAAAAYKSASLLPCRRPELTMVWVRNYREVLYGAI